MGNETLHQGYSFEGIKTVSTDAANAFLGASSRQIVTYAIVILAGYPILISLFRFQRLRWLHRKHNFPTRESLARMTDDQAWEVQKVLAQFEFPLMYMKSLQFALFRTYGIPTISAVLTKTTQFSKPETSLKRYSDTSALIQEMVGQPPSSKRAFSSIARTKFLHSSYRASGSILEDDMLYTLALFAVQPVRFINRFEWRQLTDLERCALGTFWKSLGDGLGISYEALPSGKTGFKDGIHWLEEIAAWSDAYELRCMLPHIKNRQTADQTTAMLVYMVPKPFHHIGFYFVSFMMDDRLRKAMLYDAPPPAYSKLFAFLLSIRRFVLRYLSPPRPYALRKATITEHPDENGRIFFREWEAAPYYASPSFWNRWGPTAWFTWIMGRALPGDEGDKYYPQGYFVPDVGPKYFEGKGQKPMEETLEELKTFRTGGCPFH